MNIFEGSRRIAITAATVTAAIAMLYAVIDDPHISEYYSISSPSAPFEKTTDSCPRGAGKHYFSKLSPSGHRVHITLCLLPMEFEGSKDLLIPYKETSEGVYGKPSWSDEVTRYGEELERRFVFTDEDDERISDKASQEYWGSIFSTLKDIAIGILIFAGVVSLIGWIVRGFMGIPSGMDKKPAEPSDKH
jgi:hypothetical protein